LYIWQFLNFILQWRVAILNMYFVDFITLASFWRIISCLLSVFCLVGLCKRRMSSGILSLLFCGTCILNISDFIFGKLLPNLDQKNLILTYTQDILWKKKGPNSPDFKIFSFKIFSFCVNNRFLLVAMNIEGSFHPFFSLPSIVKS